MRWKAYMAICCIWLFGLGIVVAGKSETIAYEIRYDSDSEETFEIKETVLMKYQELIRGVHDESVGTMVIHNLDHFMWRDDISASWKNNQLEVVVGDGKGTIIEGDLTSGSLCFPEVKPKSLLAQWFE